MSNKSAERTVSERRMAWDTHSWPEEGVASRYYRCAECGIAYDTGSSALLYNDEVFESLFVPKFGLSVSPYSCIEWKMRKLHSR